MKKMKSTLLLFMTAMIWGFAFVAQRVGAEHLGSFSFTGIRFVLGSISLIPVILLFEREEKNISKLKRTVFAAVIAGVVLCCASNLQQTGVALTQSAGKSGFVTGLYTVIVPIAGFLLFKKKTSICTWIGAVCAVVGLYLLCMTGNETVGLGDLVLLIGAFFWAAHIIVIDYFIDSISPLKFASMQFLVCGTISLIIALIFENITVETVVPALIPILYGGIMSVGVAYTCQILGQKDADPTFASIVFSTESVFAAIGGALILNETMAPKAYIGCIVIFAGIILSQLSFGKQK